MHQHSTLSAHRRMNRNLILPNISIYITGQFKHPQPTYTPYIIHTHTRNNAYAIWYIFLRCEALLRQRHRSRSLPLTGFARRATGGGRYQPVARNPHAATPSSNVNRRFQKPPRNTTEYSKTRNYSTLPTYRYQDQGRHDSLNAELLASVLLGGTMKEGARTG